MSELLDLIIIGAGPSGLACAIEAKRKKLNFWVIEKGCLVNSIYNFPTQLEFFTTAELLEIGNLPMIVSSEKPKRPEVLKYYRRVTDQFQLPIKNYQQVLTITGRNHDFLLRTQDRPGKTYEYHCRKVIVATGYYDHPNLLNIKGEELPKVSHYYSDPHPYFKKKTAVIGGRNSAAKAALELYRNSAEVILVHRGKTMHQQVKYWILPDINNRIRQGEIKAYFSSYIEEIREKQITVCTPKGVKILENDFVLAMTGFHPDTNFLKAIGIRVDPETLVPCCDSETLESNVKGIYLAGAVVSGKITNRVFIENGRFHGMQIFRHWKSRQ